MNILILDNSYNPDNSDNSHTSDNSGSSDNKYHGAAGVAMRVCFCAVRVTWEREGGGWQ